MRLLLNDLKISSRLTLGFGLLLILVIVLGGLALQSIVNLTNLMNTIKDHPLLVIDEVQQAKLNMMLIQRDIRELTRVDRQVDLDTLIREIDKMDQDLDSHLSIVNAQFLGRKEDLADVNRALTNWRRLRDETISLVRSNNVPETISKIEPELQRYTVQTEIELQDILGFARSKAEKLQSDADAEQKLAIKRLLLIMMGLVAGGILATRVISRSITRPVQVLCDSMANLAAGDLTAEVPYQSGQSEFADIARALKVFKESAGKLESQRWIKTTLSVLSTAMQTAVSTQELARQSIDLLVPELGGGAGMFYLWDDAGNCWSLLASYGLKKRRHLGAAFKSGESLVGQCGLERKIIVLTEVPDTYARIVSGIGEAPPRTILVAPVISKDHVLAVVEVGSFSSFSLRQLALIEEVLPIIALNLEILERNNRTQALLLQTQQQSEELRASEEELRNQSEQLQIANNELQVKTGKLQQQTEELRASEEELRAQREQLQASNEELEEKSRGLEEQATLLNQARAEADKRALERDTASRYKSEFLANMSHELRTPLNSLLILARSLRDNEQGNLTDDQVESAEIIHESGTSLLRLINDILDLSKVEAGKMEILASDIDLEQLATSLLQRFRLLAETKGLAFSVSIAEGLPRVIRTDAGKLDQIINNLIGNAIKFTEKGRVDVCFTLLFLSADTNLANQTMGIQVIDTGIGIPADKLDSVFRAFEQVDGSASRAYGGTGLGLTISRRLAQFLGGDIQVASCVGTGSTFTLLLPITAEQTVRPASMPPTSPVIGSAISAAVASQQKIDDDRNDIQPKDETILVIEDDEKFAKIVRDLSRKRGFKCLVAEDGRIGLELARRYRPTGIVLDVGLPQMNGWTVMEQLKKIPETRHIPVHFMSATESGQRGMDMGAIGYFTKPVSKEQIENAFELIRNFSATGSHRILLVDDDPNTHKAVTVLLDNNRIEVISEKTAEAALKRLQNAEAFDCIILDLGLPDMNGLNLLETCKIKQLAIPPVIVYSARDLSDQEILALREYTDSIVIKGSHSSERLLDEVTLFLHSVHNNLPNSQQQLLQKQSNKEDGLSEHTVLIVDDDMRNTFALSKVLRSRGLNVLMAQDGFKALSQLDENPDIDLVLMDIMMPGMDGYTAIAEIRQQTKFQHLPIIALTAKAMIGDREKCINAGANEYLSKPVDIDELMEMIRSCLSNQMK